MVRARRCISVALLSALALAAPQAARGAQEGPRADADPVRARRTPRTARPRVKVTIGRQLQFSGRRHLQGHAGVLPLVARRAGHQARPHPRRLRRPRARRARAPAPCRVTVSDRAGRRSNARRITVLAPPRVTGPAPAPGTLPEAFTGNGMWIWELSRSEGGDVGRDRRPRALGGDHHRLRQELGRRHQPLGAVQPRTRGRPARQRPPRLRLAVRLRQRPARRGQPRRGRDRRRRRLPRGRRRDAVRGQVRRRAAVPVRAARHGRARRTRSGSRSFPYTDYHPRLPYSVFLGPGGAQANLPQVYWKDIGGTVDAVSGHTLAAQPDLRRSDRADRPDLRRPAAGGLRALPLSVGRLRQRRAVVVVVAGRPARRSGRSWRCPSPRPRSRRPIPGWPTLLAKGNKGDQVVWLQQHLDVVRPDCDCDCHV